MRIGETPVADEHSSSNDGTASHEQFDLFEELNRESELDNDPSRVQELEAKLIDRDRLVSILTERLEQAADELDHLQRSGGASNSSDNAGPLLDEQVRTSEELKNFVNAWEERYEGPSLRRIENGIEELHDLLLEMKQSGVGPANQSTRPHSLFESVADTPCETGRGGFR